MSSERARSTPHTRDYFYVGGSYTTVSGGSEIAHGQLYVEHLAPIEKTRSIPILFIHGNGMTAVNFLNTPDGRPGWADYFLAQGMRFTSSTSLAAVDLRGIKVSTGVRAQ